MAHYKGAAVESQRAINLVKKRKLEQDEAELQKKKIEEKMKFNSIENKFSSTKNEVQLDNGMIGLLTMTEMKAKQEQMIKLLEKPNKIENNKLSDSETREIEKFKQLKKIKTLSFNLDDEEDGEEQTILFKKVKKNPEVDTSYLPDRNREELEYKMREDLKNEWIMQQQAIKAEEINITFSYWDGSGHRFQITMLKGNSIFEFLQKALTEILRKEFPELRIVTADQLMYIKEDLILPHYYTFYDFIISKARGKSGPLFQFDVKDDIRLLSDATVEKEESHAGKVVLRSWYERNKHIFPGSRWEPFNPALKTYETYTFKDKKN
ncbi:hypothetical protein PVAND_000807 [Polypedilum vanderplanki]|uniref:Protein FAM50 homolog n=1 Tax=Polypedilum vanderplanki TaxID=319348 RepID=A0A9J6BKZ8_POLVA|nr:hypothetical protein PVAND_000807 [Polypedilum vanderplanki]